MGKYAMFVIFGAVGFAVGKTCRTLEPLRSGEMPSTKEIDDFGMAASFLVATIYMLICWLLFNRVNIGLMVVIEVVCFFTYPKWAWLFVKTDKEKDRK